MSYSSNLNPKRIGLLIPSSNTVMEPDFYRGAPGGWTIHTARMYMEATTEEGESRMLDEFTFPAARDLASARPNVIVFGCTSAGALRGNEYDTWLSQEIMDKTGIPTVSVIKSVRDMIHKLGVKKLVVATPYIQTLNDRIKVSLEETGLDVMHIAGLDIQVNFDISQVTKQEILDFARQVVGTLEPELLFLSCTNFPAMSALPDLKRAFPFPVITSNKATLEAAISVARNQDQSSLHV